MVKFIRNKHSHEKFISCHKFSIGKCLNNNKNKKSDWGYELEGIFV